VNWSDVEDHVAQAIVLESPLLLSEAIALRLARAAIREMNAIRLRDVLLGDQ
jgi:hypothetical protein